MVIWHRWPSLAHWCNNESVVGVVFARWHNDVSAAGRTAVLTFWLLACWRDNELAAGRMAVLACWRNDKLAAGWMMVLACLRDDGLVAERTMVP